LFPPSIFLKRAFGVSLRAACCVLHTVCCALRASPCVLCPLSSIFFSCGLRSRQTPPPPPSPSDGENPTRATRYSLPLVRGQPHYRVAGCRCDLSRFLGTLSRKEMRLPSAPASHPPGCPFSNGHTDLGIASTTPPAVQCLSVTAPAQLAQPGQNSTS
jgi:hypothetical protein